MYCVLQGESSPFFVQFSQPKKTIFSIGQVGLSSTVRLSDIGLHPGTGNKFAQLRPLNVQSCYPPPLSYFSCREWKRDF